MTALPDGILAHIPADEHEAVLTAWRERCTEEQRAYIAAMPGVAFFAAHLRGLARGWDNFAPLNRLPDGALVRKVAFPVETADGITREWMWCRVASPEATEGELLSEASYAPNAGAGSRVAFALTPDGFAEARGWLTLDTQAG